MPKLPIPRCSCSSVDALSKTGRKTAINIKDLAQRLTDHPFVSIKQEDLPSLLDTATILREEDTLLAGWIRILSFAEMVIVQEQTPEGEIFLRKLKTKEDADKFIEARLAAYERMWDGCGCKINYLKDTSS